jgi:hypothetical protein
MRHDLIDEAITTVQIADVISRECKARLTGKLERIRRELCTREKRCDTCTVTGRCAGMILDALGS